MAVKGFGSVQGLEKKHLLTDAYGLRKSELID